MDLGSHLRFSFPAKLLSRRFLPLPIFDIGEERVLFAVTSGAAPASKVWPHRVGPTGYRRPLVYLS